MAVREPDVRYVVPENLTEEQIENAREALRDLARSLGRISARVCHDKGSSSTSTIRMSPAK